MNTTAITTKKTTQGRQKIEIKKIEKVSNRQVTFSKRRGGLFKKASELCILSGAEVAIIVKSPGKRTFAFGHPNAAAVIERYLNGRGSGGGGGGESSSSPQLRGGGGKGRSMREFNERYAEALKELEAEKRRSAVIEESKKVVNGGGFWWDEAVDGLGLEELEQYAAALEELKKNVAMRAEELVLMKASSLASAMFALNHQSAINPSGGVLADRFIIKQANGFTSSSTMVVPHGFDFGRGG